jgi:hypothetical protein
MTIIDELLALPAPDRLMICLDVFEATKKMKNLEHRANALEMLFMTMAMTVSEFAGETPSAKMPPIERKGPPPRKRRPKDFERKGPPPRSRLTHNPFAAAFKKEGDS